MSKELNLSAAPFHPRETLTVQQIMERASQIQQSTELDNSSAIDMVLEIQNKHVETLRSERFGRLRE